MLLSSKEHSKAMWEKYTEARPNLKNGDIILYSGNSLMAKSIKYFDHAYYNHIGVVWNAYERMLTMDMWSKGLTVTPLSNRINGYRDFCILRPKNINPFAIEAALSSGLDLWEGNTKYDYTLLLRIAVIKKTGIDITGLGRKGRFICSEFVQNYCSNLGIHTFDEIELITPEDFIRYIDTEKFDVLYKTNK